LTHRRPEPDFETRFSDGVKILRFFRELLSSPGNAL
jgi:hypothetical protein